LNGEKNYSYGSEGDRLCITYSLRDYDKSDFSFYLTVPNKTIQISKQVLDINGNPIADSFPQVSYSNSPVRMDGSGNVKFCNDLLLSENYIQNGVRFNASFVGDNTYDKTNAPRITVYFGENQIPEPISEDFGFSLTNPKVVDNFYNVLTIIEVGQQINLVAELSNQNNFSQDFTIQFVDGYALMDTWITGSLSSGQSLSPSSSWIPKYSGTYTVDINVFDNFINKNKLSESLTMQIVVEDRKKSTTTVDYNLIDKTIGETLWLEDEYPMGYVGVVRIIDPDMNFDPETKDDFNVDVWSDSDKRGIEVTVTETSRSTGIFETTVFFITEGESFGSELKVSVGDTVTAEYEDNTLPDPYTRADELDIIDTTLMVDPNCDVGTVLIDHVCQKEKIKEIESSKGQFCFLWWCW
jgi:hypothetical protein